MNILKLAPNTYVRPSSITSIGNHITEPDNILPAILFAPQLKAETEAVKCGEKREKKDMKLIDYLPESLKIKNIAYCDKPGKEKVILVFKDGSKVIKEMCKGDTFDLKIGVALAFMEKLYGSKTQYHKTIQKKLPQKK